MSDVFVKLVEGNDWGKIYYSTDPLDHRGCSEWRRAQHPEDGAVVTARFADGSVSKEEVVSVITRFSVSDSGRSYPVDSLLPNLRLNVRGHEVLIPLIDVEILETDLPPIRG